MSTLIQGEELKKLILGNGPVSSATGTITGDPTTVIYTVTGGEVLITSFYGKVTTALTNATGTYAIQQNPTTGDTQTLVTATALGGTDVTVGTVLGLDQGTTAASKFLGGGRTDLNAVVTTGNIEFVGALSADGAVTFYVTWVPLTTGALLVTS